MGRHARQVRRKREASGEIRSYWMIMMGYLARNPELSPQNANPPLPRYDSTVDLGAQRGYKGVLEMHRECLSVSSPPV